mmetsp:Transcript_8954/g.22628  ORF Transcript_8954/g.22628 Transcript_8954/m.22628 type:complete len:169 (-) Transcript_8954:475-981(-)
MIGELKFMTGGGPAAAAAAAGSLSGGARADGATQAGCVSESREQLTGRDATDATPTELQQPTEQQQQQEGGEARWRASCLSELPAAPSIPIVPEPRIQARSQQVLDRLVEATEGWLLGPLEVLHAQVARAVVSNAYLSDRVAALGAVEEAAQGHISVMKSRSHLTTTT